MTRKDFEAIAAIISTVKERKNTFEAWEAINSLTDELSDFFETVNPQFDRDRFFTACGC